MRIHLYIYVCKLKYLNAKSLLNADQRMCLCSDALTSWQIANMIQYDTDLLLLQVYASAYVHTYL